MSTDINDLPLDLLQDTTAALNRYVQARRREKLLEEQAYLQRELRATRENRAEIEALAPIAARPLSAQEEKRA